MSIRASCGHKVEDFEDCKDICTKEWEVTHEGWTKVLAYKSVCQTCYEDYQKNGAICETEAEEFDWLHNKEED